MNAAGSCLVTFVGFLAALQNVHSYHLKGEYLNRDRDIGRIDANPYKESADRSYPYKKSADRAYPNKVSADRTYPYKESAVRAYPYKESAVRAYPYKESADRANPYKESADRAYPYKESAVRAYPYKETADRANPYKESADRAYPYKESADRAYPYKESAVQAYPYKNSADQISQKIIAHDSGGHNGDGGYRQFKKAENYSRGMPKLEKLYQQAVDKVEHLTAKVRRLGGPELEEAVMQLKLAKTERRSVWDDVVSKACPWNLFKRCSSNSDCTCQYLKCIRRNFFFFTTSSCGYI